MNKPIFILNTKIGIIFDINQNLHKFAYSKNNVCMQKIVILDFGGQYAHLIANRVRRLGVFTEIHSPAAPVSELEGAAGIIYSGGPSSVYDENAPEYNPEIINIPVPKLGICYGHQLMAYMAGGEIAPAACGSEYGKAVVRVEKSPLFRDLPTESVVWMSHTDFVKRLPDG
ncbi:MAG: hypothetical protein J6P34_04365, partial [Paludibacteraceae bacterium]|nr:hypothetical protein [Paludibacteraceae bacterium]